MPMCQSGWCHQSGIPISFCPYLPPVLPPSLSLSLPASVSPIPYAAAAVAVCSLPPPPFVADHPLQSTPPSQKPVTRPFSSFGFRILQLMKPAPAEQTNSDDSIVDGLFVGGGAVT